MTDAERPIYLAFQGDLQKCRQILVDGLYRVDSRLGNAGVSANTEMDAIRVQLVQRKITWGESILLIQAASAKANADIQTADRSFMADINAQHQDEMARRAAAAAAIGAAAQQMQQQANQQQLINSLNRPVITNCMRFGNQVNCTSN